MATLQERYFEVLLHRARNDRYPSGQMLDRIERALGTSEQVTEYVEMLVDKVDETWYPSGQMLDRIQRVLEHVAAA